MLREKVYIDLTEGKKFLDTNKMDEWTKDDWDYFLPKVHNFGLIQIEMLNTTTLSLKISSIHYNEKSKEMFVTFEVQNRIARNIYIKFGKWKIDEEHDFDLSKLEPELISSQSDISFFSRSVKFMFLERSLKMEVDIIEEATNITIKSYDFEMKIYPTQDTI